MLFNRKWSGLYAWHVPANFLVLRLISFHCDYHWAICAKYEITSGIKCSVDSCAHVPKPAPATDMPQVAGGSLVAREVAASHRPLEDYSILNCISYCVYAPLYVAGPIVTFNTYMEYCRHPQKSESKCYIVLLLRDPLLCIPHLQMSPCTLYDGCSRSACWKY